MNMMKTMRIIKIEEQIAEYNKTPQGRSSGGPEYWRGFSAILAANPPPAADPTPHRGGDVYMDGSEQDVQRWPQPNISCNWRSRA